MCRVSSVYKKISSPVVTNRNEILWIMKSKVDPDNAVKITVDVQSSNDALPVDVTDARTYRCSRRGKVAFQGRRTS